VRKLRCSAWGLLALGVAAGTLDDVPSKRQPRSMGGYQVLAADFHVHTFPLSAGTLLPWDVVMEARRQGLDAIAITGHNDVTAGRIGRWFARRLGGPTVLEGEEIHAPGYHILALGIDRTISWRLPAARAIEEVHRQGGVAIAAHPTASSWLAFDAEAMRTLDASEVVQPLAFAGEPYAGEMRRFNERGKFTATGSSDYHGLGPLGLCRTYVFARENSEQAILEALRRGRTVVYGPSGIYGDPGLIALASRDGQLAPARAPDGWLTVLSRLAGVPGLLSVMLFGFRN
jgi:PHP-associated